MPDPIKSSGEELKNQIEALQQELKDADPNKIKDCSPWIERVIRILVMLHRGEANWNLSRKLKALEEMEYTMTEERKTYNGWTVVCLTFATTAFDFAGGGVGLWGAFAKDPNFATRLYHISKSLIGIGSGGKSFEQIFMNKNESERVLHRHRTDRAKLDRDETGGIKRDEAQSARDDIRTLGQTIQATHDTASSILRA